MSLSRVDRRAVARSLAVVVAAGSLVAASGCGGRAHAEVFDAVVPVDLSNFKITVPAHVKAGVVKFVLRGVGPTMHEFNVVRTDGSASALPLAADGTVDDKSPHPDFVHLAEREGVDIGGHASLIVRLRPGRYVVYCNMYGHFQAGMRAEVTVS
jgi:uncharacterized cupredoxin-like copper-binding protein